MAVGPTSQFRFCPNSSNFTIRQGQIVNYSNTVCNAVGLLVVSALLTLLILYKAFKTVLQRLFLYFTVVVAVDLVVLTLNVELQFQVSEDFCSWIGYLSQSIGITQQIMATCLVIFISITTCHKLWPRAIGPCFKKISPCCSRVLEVSYLCAVCILPAACLSLLLKKGLYGLSQTLCWFKFYEEGCTKANQREVALDVTTAVVLFLRYSLLLAMLVLMVIFHIMILKHQQNNQVSRDISCRTSFLLAMAILSVFAKTSDFMVNAIVARKKVPINEFYYDLIDNLVQITMMVLLTLAFATYMYSPTKLKPSSIKRAWKEWSCVKGLSTCCRRNAVCSCMFRKRVRSIRRFDERQHTYQSSVNYSTPSHTTYSTPYTNEFTDITEIINCERDRPLQYGSIGE